MKKQKYRNKEMFSRMNYLYQASHLLQSLSRQSQNHNKKQLNTVSRYYIKNMKLIGTKNLNRIDSSVKRSICKNCDQILIPGNSCSIEIIEEINETNNSSAIQIKCTNCNTKKQFNENVMNNFGEKGENFELV
ncbi:Rpr2-domain-containing protein [Conidiobolus coronatus NRRL 28638]|uniref:Rpr2-domain-containing protein n=1 Tax=Conidiobolus coronatus (strain ATCC 28846 / CBS 209.66 / NRRL 28638) TaxID=796925 RepID=A0A137PGA1_CONC2|nr:Rpr2-domain-containing protein [Conidiobolus coronatus NRRL 28638]|eukprot:KXN74000.1 Rpr2-domain-containing protein [Conidiobolus coronatus NRRL 28638]